MTPATVVFVPGAWLGEWSWHPVARRVRAAGHNVLGLTLPGLAYGSSSAGLRLADAVDHVVQAIEDRDLRDVVLVCHSWGGYPATGAAFRLPDRVRRIVYYNAVVPEIGQSMADENDEYGAVIRQAISADPDGAVSLTLDATRLGLMPGEPEAVQRLVFEMLLPQPGAYMTDSLDDVAVTSLGIDASYLLGVDDQSLARPGEVFAARLGIEPSMVPGGHLALLSAPDDIADAVVRAIG